MTNYEMVSQEILNAIFCDCDRKLHHGSIPNVHSDFNTHSTMRVALL